MQLILPTEQYWPSFMDCLAEFKANPAPFGLRVTERDVSDFATYQHTTETARAGIDIPDGSVPYTELWLIKEEKVIGLFVVRHTLNPILRHHIGHIGYAIRPAERGKGFGHKGLALCLDYAADTLGLDKVMISCHADNVASYNIMKAAMINRSGVEEAPVTTPEGDTFKRVWVNTKARHGKIRPLAVVVIRRGEKVLAVQGYDDIKKEYFYRLVGGGIEFGETGAETIAREFREELGFTPVNIQLSHITENIFTFNGHPGHEIVLVYTADLPPEHFNETVFPFIEEGRECLSATFVDTTTNQVYPTGALK